MIVANRKSSFLVSKHSIIVSTFTFFWKLANSYSSQSSILKAPQKINMQWIWAGNIATFLGSLTIVAQFVCGSWASWVFTARRCCIARTMPLQDVCLSLRLSIRPSHTGIVCKRLHISSKFLSPSGSPTILVFPHISVTICERCPALSQKWCQIEP